MALEIKDLEPISNGITEIKAEQKEAANKHKETAEEIKSVKTEVTETKNSVETIKSDVETVKKETTELKQWQVKKDERDLKTEDAVDKLLLDKKRVPLGGNGSETKSFNEIIGQAIESNTNKIKNFKKGDPELKLDLMPDYKETTPDGRREVKAVGDMSITANFSSANTLYSDRQTGLIQSPYNRVWLADILPQGTSTGTSIIYPKENGGEGAAAVWEDPSSDKPQIDFDLTTQTAYFKWIAGIVIVDREMLDDIAFLTSYIQNKMLISLKTAENSFILNGTSGTNPVTGLLTAADTYDGNYTKNVDIIIDAAWGQIVENTDEFYSPTTVVMMPRDAVRIGLNTASGSGEYDLPPGSVAFQNGKLTIGGLDLVVTTRIGDNTFLTFDKAATMFVKRMQPELRVFEDSTLAKRNKVMFRIEERATLAIFNNNALVQGTLDSGS